LGIILKQSIKGSVYSYFGILIGFINVAILFPILLSTKEVGLINILITYSILFAQFSSLGLANIITRLFPYFRDKNNKNNGFLFLILSIALVGFVIGTSVFILISPTLISEHKTQSPLFVEYIYYIIPLMFFLLLFNVLDTYNKVLYNATFGVFLKDIVLRLLNLSVILAYFFKLISFEKFVLFYILTNGIIVFLLIILLIIKKEFYLFPKFKFIDKKLRNSIISVGAFGIIAGLSGIAIANIDKVMINIDINLGLSYTGVYSIAFFYGSIIIKPSLAVKKISSVLIADAWKNNDTKKISEIYNKSSINLFIVGVYLFLGIWCNIHNVFKILPQEYTAGKYVILFIALANLVEMLAGVSGPIMGNSKYYKTLSFFMVFLVFLLIISNYFLIPLYGITGAGLASFLSYCIFVLLRHIFLLKKYKFQPIKIGHLYVLLLGVFVMIVLEYAIPKANSFVLDIAVRGTIITIIFGVGILVLNISADINEKFNKLKHKLLKK